MKPCPWNVAELLPHQPPMLLLERAVGYDETRVVVTADLGPGNPFVTAQGLPAHVGIELMAQACGAWVGANALAAGKPVRMGYLLGTRHYQAEAEWLAGPLEVAAEVVLCEGGMGVFNCRIGAGDRILATAQLTLFQPEGEA